MLNSNFSSSATTNAAIISKTYSIRKGSNSWLINRVMGFIIVIILRRTMYLVRHLRTDDNYIIKNINLKSRSLNKRK